MRRLKSRSSAGLAWSCSRCRTTWCLPYLSPGKLLISNRLPSWQCRRLCQWIFRFWLQKVVWLKKYIFVRQIVDTATRTLFMWSTTCPQYQILLELFEKTRLFTKHVCIQLMSWFQIPSHPSTQRRRESIVEQWRRRRRGWGRIWRRRTLGAAHGKHIQVLATLCSFKEVIYICQADSGLQQPGSVVVCSLSAISSLTYV